MGPILRGFREPLKTVHPGDGSFGRGLRSLDPHSPLRGCSGLAASASPKIPRRRAHPIFQTGDGNANDSSWNANHGTVLTFSTMDPIPTSLVRRRYRSTAGGGLSVLTLGLRHSTRKIGSTIFSMRNPLNRCVPAVRSLLTEFQIGKTSLRGRSASFTRDFLAPSHPLHGRWSFGMEKQK